MSVLERVRRMSPHEVAFRLRAAARAQAQRASLHVAAPRWDRAALRRVLDMRRLDREGHALLARREWSQLDRHLRAGMRMRPAQYVLNPSDAAEVSRTIAERWPDAPGDAAREADRILAGRYDLLGYADLALSPDPSSIRWHRDPVHGTDAPRRFWADVPFLDPSCGDHKIIWELNRHQHFLRLGRALWLTGDRRYGDRIVAEVLSWMRDNPPLVGINWASMLELGFRSLSWVAAIHFLLGVEDEAWGGVSGEGGAPWMVDMCLALDRQLAHVEANLSYYFSPNTHLTGEALALYVAGTALPELARSGRWAARGRAVLLHEAGVQIARDGGHIERSTHYHRYTLDFYTLALQTAGLAGDSEAAAQFRETVDRLATFMRAMADEQGRMPLIGDDDGGQLWPIAGRDPRDVRDSLSAAALLLDRSDLTGWVLPEEAFWLAPAHARATPASGTRDAADRAPVATRVFPETGFVTVHTSDGDHGVFDVGPHGFGNGGHAHADALSVTLTLHGRPLLVDPGTATYTMDVGLRDRMRSSLLHNTVTFDGRSSAKPGGPFKWTTTANGRLEEWRGNRRLLVAQASHDGYAPLYHVRTVIYGLGGWLIADEARARATVPHEAEARWHFDPGWTVRLDGERCARAAADGAAAILCVDDGTMSLIEGAADRSGGWVSPRYGLLVPSTTVAVARTLRPGEPMFTWIGRDAAQPVLRRVSGGDASAQGVALESGSERIVTVLRRASGSRIPGAAADRYRTDAFILQYSRGAGSVAVALVDGTHADTDESGLLSVASSGGVRDLVVSFDGVTLEVCASHPPSELRISGAQVGTARRIVLNGVDTVARPSSGGPIVLRTADWHPRHRGGEGDTSLWHHAPAASAQPAAS